MKHLLNILMTMSFAFAIFSCSEDSVAPKTGPGEEELITTVTLTLTPTSGTVVTASWRDLDGDGGNDPVIDTLRLAPNTTYSGSIALLNEQEDPAEDITEEINEEADNHQLFYSPGGGIAASVVVTVTDTDSRNLPVGLTYSVAVDAGAAGQSGDLRVTLYHYDDSADKDGTSPSTETDVQIDIPVIIVN